MHSVSNQLTAIAVLVAISAFFSCSETALFSLGRLDIQKMKQLRLRTAERVLRILRRRREFLITILLGTEISNISISILVAGIVYIALPEPTWQRMLIASVLITTPLNLIFCEIIPKNVAIRHSARIAPFVAFPLRLFYWLTYPIRLPFTFFLDKVLEFFGGDLSHFRMMIREDEFRQLVDTGEKEGSVHEEEAELIHGVFSLSDHTVQEIMTPRGRLFSVSFGKSIDDILSEIRETQFSRIPVYVPASDSFCGVLYVKDVLALRKYQHRGRAQEIEDIIRPALYVSPETKLDEMLREFQGKKIHLALVESREGEVLGVVTMTDILDKLIGEKEESAGVAEKA